VIRDTGLSSTAPADARWPAAGQAKRLPAASFGAACLLHGAACVLVLVVASVPAPPLPAEEQAVELVFAPPDAPARAPEEPPAPPMAETPPEPPMPEIPPAPVAAETPPRPAEPPAPAAETTPAPAIKSSPPEAPKRRPEAPRQAAPRSAVAEHLRPAQNAEPESTAAARPEPPRQLADAPIAVDWQRSLTAWLAGHRIYPPLALRRGIEGDVLLRFTAVRSGHVLDVSLVHSAGSPLLDGAAEALVRDATLPAFPAAMTQASATVTVTIHYALTH
jgi:TonB family protein